MTKMLKDCKITDAFPKQRDVAIILGLGTSARRFEDKFNDVCKIYDPVIFGVNRIFKQEYLSYRPIHYYTAADRHCWRYDLNKICDLKCLSHFAPARYKQDADIPMLFMFEFGKDPLAVAMSKQSGLGHGFTSVCVASQLALIQGAKILHFFGVDCVPDPETGQTHLYGTAKRKEKIWNCISKGINNLLDFFELNHIEYYQYSDLFVRFKRV